jgi:shikimate kinase
VGLPGAGKSTAGRLLALRLGWDFTDVDLAIEAAAGASVGEIFATRGEAGFRQLELRLTAELSSREQVVLAPGGGWAAQPGSLEGLPAGTLLVWLRVKPAEALRRLRGSSVSRPLLTGADPLGALQGLARQRSERYQLAHLVVEVDEGSAADTARYIHEWLERRTS